MEEREQLEVVAEDASLDSPEILGEFTFAVVPDGVLFVSSAAAPAEHNHLVTDAQSAHEHRQLGFFI